MMPWTAWALKELGVHEKPGPGSNPKIIEYRRIAKINIKGDDSKIPWCAIFVNASLEANNIRGTRSAAARSFSRSPHFIRLLHPVEGCITVFSSSRGSWSGHVGIYQSHSKSRIVVISGNSDNGVTLNGYPSSRLVGHYWPRSVPVPKNGGPVIKESAGGRIPSDA